MDNLGIVLANIFISNVVLTRFWGLCPFFGVSKGLGAALGMGAAVIFVLSLAGFLSASLYYFALVPLGLEFLKLLIFIFIIASVVQFVEMLIHKLSPSLYQVLGIYLPLITSNCAVLGIALWNIEHNQYSVIESTLAGFSAGIGFTLVLVLMASIRQRLQLERVPRFLQGAPIAFISAGIMALGFYIFDVSMLHNLGLRS